MTGEIPAVLTLVGAQVPDSGCLVPNLSSVTSQLVLGAIRLSMRYCLQRSISNIVYGLNEENTCKTFHPRT